MGLIDEAYRRWPWADAVAVVAVVVMGFLQWWVPASVLALLAALRTVLRMG